jgi:hypothetical protein
MDNNYYNYANTIDQYKYDAGADIISTIYILIADVTANITNIRTRPRIYT